MLKINIFWAVFKKPLRMRHCFLFGPYFMPLLKEPRESQALERSKAMHHRQKALQSPEQYMCLIVDGMDQKKTCLPHFRRLPKDIGDECLVQMVACHTVKQLGLQFL